MRRHLRLLAVLLAAPLSTGRAQLTSTPQFFAVDPRATYLRTGAFDNPALPTIIYLGVTGPSMITFVATGNYSVAGPTQSGKFWAVFSSSSTLLANNGLLNRVPDAIDVSGPDIIEALTGPAFYDGQPMDIAEDFYLAPGTNTFMVPTGAQYLFLGIPDSFLADNSTPDRATLGGYASVHSVVPEPSTWALTGVGLSLLGVLGRRRKAHVAERISYRRVAS